MALTSEEIKKDREDARIVLSRGEGSYGLHHNEDNSNVADLVGQALPWVWEAVGEACRDDTPSPDSPSGS